MFNLIKTFIWLVGLFVVTVFVLDYFGYEVNRNYFQERKTDCKAKVEECKSELIHQGLDNAQCNFNCIDPKLIIKEKQENTEQESAKQEDSDRESVEQENTEKEASEKEDAERDNAEKEDPKQETSA